MQQNSKNNFYYGRPLWFLFPGAKKPTYNTDNQNKYVINKIGILLTVEASFLLARGAATIRDVASRSVTWRNMPEERKPQPHRWGKLKNSHKKYILFLFIFAF